MAHPADTRTSVTLLEKLRRVPADAEAWARFVQQYGPAILEWCRKWGLQDADALDVSQEVLERLLVKMQSFEYERDGSFRGWLNVVTRHAWCDLTKKRRDQGGPAYLARIETLEARDDLTARIKAEHDREILEEASGRVRERVNERTWIAFRMLAFDRKSGAETAGALGLSIAAAFECKKRVIEMLRAEVIALDPPGKD